MCGGCSRPFHDPMWDKDRQKDIECVCGGLKKSNCCRSAYRKTVLALLIAGDTQKITGAMAERLRKSTWDKTKLS